MSLWHDIKVRLGLEEEWDEEYETEEYYDEEYEPDDSGDDDFYGRSVYESPYADRSASVRRLDRGPDLERAKRAKGRDVLREAPPAEVTPMTPHVKMHIVEPKSYNEVKGIADRYKQGTPVIMNMTMTSPDVAKRLLDFAAGLTYGMDGGLDKISDRVFMLTPANVDVSAGDFRHLKEKGLFTLE